MMKTAVGLCALVWFLVGLVVLAATVAPNWGVLTVCVERMSTQGPFTHCRSFIGFTKPKSPLYMGDENGETQ